MSEDYVKIVQDMYRSSKTQVVTQKDEIMFPNRGGITPRISHGSSLAHYNNGLSN